MTECLWAKVFREADAADIGYSAICYPGQDPNAGPRLLQPPLGPGSVAPPGFAAKALNIRRGAGFQPAIAAFVPPSGSTPARTPALPARGLLHKEINV